MYCLLDPQRSRVLLILLEILGMDGIKEKERERGDEKESDETEEDAEGAALLWQEGYPEDDLGLPIMHWEDLGLRIAELEKQQEERRQREKVYMKLKTVEHYIVKKSNKYLFCCGLAGATVHLLVLY